MTISSQHNQKLKEIRKLRQRRRWRERAGRFVAEGEDLLSAADAAGWPALERFCAAGSGLPGTEVDPKLLASASGLGSGTRALAVYEERWAERAPGPVCVYLYGVHDPGNVGTVLRSARAFGAASVAIGPGSADPFSPKAVRASMGAIFSVPVVRAGDVDALPGIKIALAAHAGTPLAELCRIDSEGASPDGKVQPDHRDRDRDHGRDRDHDRDRDRDRDHHDHDYRDPHDYTLLIGSEREGLPPELLAQADHTAHIPIATDSLNAAMAATIALYELRTTMPRT